MLEGLLRMVKCAPIYNDSNYEKKNEYGNILLIESSLKSISKNNSIKNETNYYDNNSIIHNSTIDPFMTDADEKENDSITNITAFIFARTSLFKKSNISPNNNNLSSSNQHLNRNSNLINKTLK